MIAVFIALCLVVGYIFGCFSTAYVVGKINKIDIREHGSQNAGTTNTIRTLGKKAGIVVFLGDCIKAVLAMLIMFLALQNTELDIETIKLATGFGAVLGHNFPFWLNFKGGKGIAVTGAVIIAFSMPNHIVCFFVCLILFVGFVKITKYVSLGSLSVVTAFLAYNVIVFNGDSNYVRIVILTLAFTVSAFIMHRENIKRLLNGTENKTGQNKKPNNMMQNNNMQNMNNNMMQNNMQNMNNNMMQNNNMQNMNNMMQNNNMQNMNNNMMQNNNMQNMNNNMMQNNNMQNMNGNMMQNNNMQNMNGNVMQNNNGQSGDNNSRQTSGLYSTGYINQIRANLSKKANKKDNDYYKAYDSYDTMDETRELSENEINENYNSDYYKNI
ncbi:MAG: glycerol-3-phosphate 1-O-acyltransferase PlsY [Lachnospiraceae bacterium]|nr:glycerol-3-phosphate 1-O-acyltransferase PlsY [Lachnospiraceae bacterium]